MDQSENNSTPPDRHSFLDSLRNSDPGFESSKNHQTEEEVTFEEQNAGAATNLIGNTIPSTDPMSLFQPKQMGPTATETGLPPRVPVQSHDVTAILNESTQTKPRTASALRGPKKPHPISNRARSVSFDRQALNKAETDGLRHTSDESARSPVPQTSNPPPADVNPRDLWQQQKSERSLTMDDLLTSGPYELEAETNILRAFEEHQHLPAPRRISSEMPSVFSGVPEAMTHDFSLEDEITDLKKPDEEEKTNSTLGDVEKAQRVPLVRSHSRRKSVGDQLVGLTHALQTLEEAGTVTKEVTPLDGVVSNHDGRDRLYSLEEGLEVLVEGNEESYRSNEPQLTGPPLPRDSNRKSHGAFVVQGAKNMVEEHQGTWKTFLRPRLGFMRSYVKNIGFLLFCLIATAGILFYFAGNPVAIEGQASVSWYLLFCARQIVTLTLALVTQAIVIDLLCVGTKVLLRLLGQYVTLLLIMSKGWPFVLFMWSLYNFGMLHGNRTFSKHWGFWMSIDLVNDSNPSGEVVQSAWNGRVLFIALFLSIATTLKRFFVGLYLGRQTFVHYGPKLAKVMGKILVVSKVAYLAKKIKKSSASRSKNPREVRAKYADKYADMRDSDDASDVSFADSPSRGGGTALDMNKMDPLTGRLDNLEREKLMQLLERWEEPTRISGQGTAASIAEVLRFRKALTFIDDIYPFSYAFGLADTRDSTIRSAQELYLSLRDATPLSDVIQFETIAEIALLQDGSIDEDKAKEAIRIFRPDREGNLTLVDFIKSVDSIYKEFRLLQASIQNSSKIDQAFESIFNVAFYGASITIILSQIGVDPLALFLSFSSVIFAFAFMISAASSKYFEGLLFIIVRRPYGIGDMIHISDVQQDTSVDGSQGWIVSNVTLTHTTATWHPTMEQANFSNASLSASRIINWARSPNAKFNITLNFPISTKYETIEIFKRAVEEYLKVRPREWLSLNGFRVKHIYAEKGYMDVGISCRHREAWQNVTQVLDSKANLVTYCHEVQKKLGMRYIAPIVPIELIDNRSHDSAPLLDIQTGESSTIESQNAQLHDEEIQFQQFRSMAREKYNIRMG